MPFVRITDLSDPRLEVYRDLPKQARAKRSDLFIAESRLVVDRLLATELETVSVLCSDRETAALQAISAQRPELPIFVLSDDLVRNLIGYKLHRGQLACAKCPANEKLSTWIESDANLLVLCPQITDPVNLAGVIRNCTAFGVDGLILGTKSAWPYTRRTVRVSMGTIFNQPIRVSADLRQDLEQLGGAGYQLSATVLDRSARRLSEATLAEKCVLLFGSEGPGLAEEWIEMSDQQLTIPMERGTDSLNLATATGIFLHHFTQGR